MMKYKFLGLLAADKLLSVNDLTPGVDFIKLFNALRLKFALWPHPF
jgi:hypothetical protein